MSRRRYGQYCGLAAALDLVGERWTLLIVRDLLGGPQRYRDLAARQPGLASDLLTARLKLLVDAGLVEKVRLPPPGHVDAYRLTDAGDEALRPVVDALVRFGVERLPRPLSTDDRLDVTWAFGTLAIALGDAAPDDGGLFVDTDTGTAHLHRAAGAARVSHGVVAPPAVSLRGPTAAVLGVLLGHVTAAAVAADLIIDGDPDAFERWCDAIQRTAPSSLRA
ncbi:MAG: helix-turn-helix domain-containing protein [Actinomycetota bacterium]